MAVEDEARAGADAFGPDTPQVALGIRMSNECLFAELGLAESSDGIMPLPEDAPVGKDFRELMDLDDQCIEVDLTPDRGDCLSLAGIAREVGVINRSPLTIPETPEVAAGIEDACAAEVQAPAACPR